MAEVIAIDGPSGAGKSSVSKIVAAKKGYFHVDSGALYRIVTWQCLERGVDTSNPEAVAKTAGEIEIECKAIDGRIAYFIGGKEPGDELRTPEINAHASHVAAVPEVREKITSLLRSLVRFGGLVIEGRDITSAVFPDSPHRFYLTASAEARAARRMKEQVEKGISNESASSVQASLMARDKLDSTRKCAPLVKADGVIEIDSSNLTLDEVVSQVLDSIR